MEEKPVRVDTMTAIVNKVERIFGFAPKISGILGEFGALAMVLLIIIGVTFRYVLRLPLAFDAECH